MKKIIVFKERISPSEMGKMVGVTGRTICRWINRYKSDLLSEGAVKIIPNKKRPHYKIDPEKFVKVLKEKGVYC